MLGCVLLKWWASMETTRSGSFPRGKQPINSLPNVSLTSRHSTVSSPLSSFPTTNFVRMFSFFSTYVFFFFVFGVKATRSFEVYECVVWAPLKLLLQFILFNLQELNKLIQLNNDIMRYIILHVFHKKTFFDWCQGEFIADFVYWPNEARQLFFPWVL